MQLCYLYLHIFAPNRLQGIFPPKTQTAAFFLAEVIVPLRAVCTPELPPVSGQARRDAA